MSELIITKPIWDELDNLLKSVITGLEKSEELNNNLCGNEPNLQFIAHLNGMKERKAIKKIFVCISEIFSKDFKKDMKFDVKALQKEIFKALNSPAYQSSEHPMSISGNSNIVTITKDSHMGLDRLELTTEVEKLKNKVKTLKAEVKTSNDRYNELSKENVKLDCQIKFMTNNVDVKTSTSLSSMSLQQHSHSISAGSLNEMASPNSMSGLSNVRCDREQQLELKCTDLQRKLENMLQEMKTIQQEKNTLQMNVGDQQNKLNCNDKSIKYIRTEIEDLKRENKRLKALILDKDYQIERMDKDLKIDVVAKNELRQHNNNLLKENNKLETDLRNSRKQYKVDQEQIKVLNEEIAKLHPIMDELKDKKKLFKDLSEQLSERDAEIIELNEKLNQSKEHTVGDDFSKESERPKH